jgi:uncharacterized C2H2 Zn-finger protein
MTWHPVPLNADQVVVIRCPVCGSVFEAHICHGWDEW